METRVGQRYKGDSCCLLFQQGGCGSDVHLLLGVMNLSQIQQYSHNKVSVILVSESSRDSLA